MTNGKKSAQAKKKRTLDLATPRALLRKHARIKKNGRVELKKGVAAGVNPRFFGGTSLAACCQAWVMNKGPSPAPCS